VNERTAASPAESNPPRPALVYPLPFARERAHRRLRAQVAVRDALENARDRARSVFSVAARAKFEAALAAADDAVNDDLAELIVELAIATEANA
jgi:hypothetical protein